MSYEEQEAAEQLVINEVRGHVTPLVEEIEAPRFERARANGPIYEWYQVSDWLAFELAERGEVVVSGFGLPIWGRTTTGQALKIDAVLQDIATQ